MSAVCLSLIHILHSASALASELSEKTGSVVVVTGETDVVADRGRLFYFRGGHQMMRSVTGTGCQLSVLTAAFVAANPDMTAEAAFAAVAAMGLCGEIAYERLSSDDGNSSYRNYIIDAVYRLSLIHIYSVIIGCFKISASVSGIYMTEIYNRTERFSEFA